MTKKKNPPSNAPRGIDGRDAQRDFYFDELMTPQPDATREFFRARLLKPAKPPKDSDKS